MSDTPKQGPVLNEAIEEVHGHFLHDAALQDAIDRLERAGFDRAQINLPTAETRKEAAAPAGGAEAPMKDDDAQQLRTLGSSLAAGAGAMLGAGLTVMTGGVAGVAIAVAAGAGLAAGGGVMAATSSADSERHEAHEARGREGRLVLSVTLQGDADPARAEAVMREAGATEVERVRRVN